MISGDELAQAVTVAIGLAIFVSVLAAANAGEQSALWRTLAYAGVIGLCTIVALLAMAGISNAVTVPGAVAASGVSATRVVLGNLLELVGALCAPLFLLPWARRQLARLLHAFQPESTINAVAASMYVLVLVYLLSSQVSVDQIKAIERSGTTPPLWLSLATNQLPFLVVAVAGVGLFVRRGIRETLQRLGLYWPGWRWIAGSAVVAVLLVVFGILFDDMMTRLTPDQSRSINDISQRMFSSITNPGTALAVALAAGIGEEVLFRGALQPRLGIVAAALLFAVLHTQYSLSLASVEIFILGLALGLLRKRGGLMTAIIAHTGYDFILLMIPLVVHR